MDFIILENGDVIDAFGNIIGVAVEEKKTVVRSKSLRSKPIRTKMIEKFIEEKIADEIFDTLKKTTKWTPLKSRSKTLRLGAMVEFEELDVLLKSELKKAIKKLSKESNDSLEKNIHGIYLNYYKSGKDYAGSHKHDTTQIVLSFGTTRTLNVGKKSYKMGHGSVIIFGKSMHGIPKEDVDENNEFDGERISLAAFFE